MCEKGNIVLEGIHNRRATKAYLVECIYFDDELGDSRVFGYEIQEYSPIANKMIGMGFYPDKESAIAHFESGWGVSKNAVKTQS